jgi:UDP-N-acetylglucosamine 2-epimerase (non-hydrolysing)
VRDEPFPEGIDTRLATVCSQLLFAPVSINRQILLKEGQSSKDIHIVGSLSADAVDLICRQPADSSVFNIYPFLKEGSWIRIDLHRRENMMATTIRNILEAVQKLARRGFRIIIIMTNALNRAIQVHDLKNEVAELLKYENVKITPIWQEYYHVIEFIRSGHCLGLYTDSGGLQEETQILNVPCITCRYSTDRPETVILVKNNLLVPPFSATFISQSLEYIFTNKPDLFTNHDRLLYSTDVGKKIADILKDHSPVPSPVLHDVFDSAVINQ